MKTAFQKLHILVKNLKRLPVNYRNFTGREFVTYYTTTTHLAEIALRVGTDITMERDIRLIQDPSLKELGFKQIALYFDKFTNESIAILGV